MINYDIHIFAKKLIYLGTAHLFNVARNIIQILTDIMYKIKEDLKHHHYLPLCFLFFLHRNKTRMTL